MRSVELVLRSMLECWWFSCCDAAVLVRLVMDTRERCKAGGVVAVTVLELAAASERDVLRVEELGTTSGLELVDGMLAFETLLGLLGLGWVLEGRGRVEPTDAGSREPSTAWARDERL